MEINSSGGATSALQWAGHHKAYIACAVITAVAVTAIVVIGLAFAGVLPASWQAPVAYAMSTATGKGMLIGGAVALGIAELISVTILLHSNRVIDQDFQRSMLQPGWIKSADDIDKLLRINPRMVNKKIDFGNYKQVYISHLLCSSYLFPANLEKTLELLKVVSKKIDLSLIDNSNLWNYVGFEKQGSGNNVLKSAVAAASGSVSGSPERKPVVAYLLGLLEKMEVEKRRQILDAGDNFPLGSHTIPEFLVRQGNEDLALKAIEMGASITDDLLLSSAASAGTTAYGTILTQYVLDHYITNNRSISVKVHWKLRVCLSAVPQSTNLTGLLNLGDRFPEIKEEAWKFWTTISFHGCIGNIPERVDFNPFGLFSDQYREDNSERKRPFNLRSEFVSTAEGVAAFQELHSSCKQITVV